MTHHHDADEGGRESREVEDGRTTHENTVENKVAQAELDGLVFVVVLLATLTSLLLPRLHGARQFHRARADHVLVENEQP